VSYCFPKEIRLRKRHQYQRMGNGCRRHNGLCLLIESRLNNFSKTRLGITVTRRYGDAHERNRFKRIVREAFRLCYAQIPSGYDLNIKPRSEAKKAKTPDVMAEIIGFAKDLANKGA
jgi:ribonuclease P protein component